MKIAVCVKVIDGEPNPFDAAALESALRLGGEITVVSMCPPSAEEPLRRLTRLGISAVLLCDAAFAGSDTLATARVLAAAMRRLEPDLILCGRQTIDGDTAQVGPCLATLLGLPVIPYVMEFGPDWTVKTRLGDRRVVLPCLLTVERICELRFPSLRARAGSVEVWDNQKLGIPPEECGLHGSPTRVLKTFENQRGRRHCQWIAPETLPELLKELAARKREETRIEESPVKLKEVWTVGELSPAAAIAETVRVISETDPEKIARLAKAEKPEAILWNADLRGRSHAPVCAALLQTGLCADCTSLETDGERLYMFRPARSGSITAKIVCRTRPQMATVRMVSDSAQVVAAAGRGIRDCYPEFLRFVEKIGAEPGASRGLVDAGAAPYSQQVGLTGKSVSPNVYLAMGISGAVHHTCAIEGAGTVIAVNPDKDARIFAYADYGILAPAREVMKKFM